jgi:hypothetical protein
MGREAAAGGWPENRSALADWGRALLAEAGLDFAAIPVKGPCRCVVSSLNTITPWRLPACSGLARQHLCCLHRHKQFSCKLTHAIPRPEPPMGLSALRSCASSCCRYCKVAAWPISPWPRSKASGITRPFVVFHMSSVASPLQARCVLLAAVHISTVDAWTFFWPYQLQGMRIDGAGELLQAFPSSCKSM